MEKCNYFIRWKRSADSQSDAMKWQQIFLICYISGSTAYVLTLDGSPLLWNAHTGHKYDVQDANCPLKSIGCVFNHENVRVVLLGPGAGVVRTREMWGGFVIFCEPDPQTRVYISTFVFSRTVFEVCIRLRHEHGLVICIYSIIKKETREAIYSPLL